MLYYYKHIRTKRIVIFFFRPLLAAIELNKDKRREERLIVASRLTIEDIFQYWLAFFFASKHSDKTLVEMISISGFLHCVRKSLKVNPIKFGKDWLSREKVISVLTSALRRTLRHSDGRTDNSIR